MTHDNSCDGCGRSDKPGKAQLQSGQTLCDDCSGALIDAEMRTNGKATLYLSKYDDQYYVTDWPGTLRFKVWSMRKGKHNMARVRYDVAFTHGNHVWHGVTYGDMTQICHCKRTKTTV